MRIIPENDTFYVKGFMEKSNILGYSRNPVPIYGTESPDSKDAERDFRIDFVSFSASTLKTFYVSGSTTITFSYHGRVKMMIF